MNVQTTTVTQISSSTTPVPKGPGLVGSKRSRRIRSGGSCTDVKQIKKGRKAPGGAKKGKETAIFLRSESYSIRLFFGICSFVFLAVKLIFLFLIHFLLETYDMITKCDESLASWYVKIFPSIMSIFVFILCKYTSHIFLI